MPKAGRNSHTTPEDFKHINLSSLFKTMELLDVNLRQTLDGNVLSKGQHVYNKGRSPHFGAQKRQGL